MRQVQPGHVSSGSDGLHWFCVQGTFVQWAETGLVGMTR